MYENMNSLKKIVKGLGKGIATVSLAAGLGYGCYQGVNVTENTSKFFVCNYWLDKDQDSKVDDDEFVGVKDSFRASEEVTLVAEVYNRKGDVMTAKVISGKGKLVYERRAVIPCETCNRKYTITPWFLYNEGGVGTYTVKWEINGTRVGINTFTLNR